MANYIVQDTSLAAVADAIRAKTGGGEALAFPAGFVEAVEGITGGGGGGGGSTRYHTIDEQVVSLDVDVSIAGGTTIDADRLANMNTWCRNEPAASAYTSIAYNAETKENVCQYTGVGMFEVIGLPLLLESGKRYTFTVEYYTPNEITGDYAEPYAPYIGFLPISAFGTNADPFPSCYAHTGIDLSVADYKTYSCTFTPNENLMAGAAFVMGSTTDGVSVELRLKNISLTID